MTSSTVLHARSCMCSNRLAQLKMDLRSYFVLKLHITSLVRKR